MLLGHDCNIRMGGAMKLEDIPEYMLRVWKLMDPPRSMSHRAAKIVVEAAMFGIGCLEGEMRKKIEQEKTRP